MLRSNPSHAVKLLGTVIVVSLLPIKLVGAFSAIIASVAILILCRKKWQLNIVVLISILYAYFAICLLYLLFTDSARWQNMFLFALTASSFLILFLQTGQQWSAKAASKARYFLAVAILAESAVGILQAIVQFMLSGTFDGASGDYVRGTIELDLFTTAGTGSNQMFAIIQSSMLLMYLALTKGKLRRGAVFIVAIGLLSWVLASVMHTLVYFTVAALVVTAAVVISSSFRRRIQVGKLRRIIPVVGVVLGGIILTSWALPRNLSQVPSFVKYGLQSSPHLAPDKLLVTYLVATRLPKDAPQQPFIGLGPGQFSSRAALIASGTYLSVPIPFQSGATDYTDRYLMPIWSTFRERHPAGGSTFFPFYSWLSLYAEFGIVGILAIFALGVSTFRLIVRRAPSEYPMFAPANGLLLLYLAFLGLHDNYWEWTQAVAPAFMFLSLARSGWSEC